VSREVSKRNGTPEGSMTYRTIEQERCGRVSLIRLNRPERMNAVIEEMYLEIQAALEAARADAGIRCLVLTGSILTRDGIEKQAFCAGADLKEHAAGKRSPEERRSHCPRRASAPSSEEV
jgi:enoyl-CoA hydratase